MVVPLHAPQPAGTPVLDLNELRTESDVEQKQLFPFLINPLYLGLPTAWVRTKEYMAPTEIDKTSGKRRGYVPDYSVWIGGLPVLIVEAKAVDVTIESALREARLYASEINKRYPPNVNPIAFVFASNGEQLGLSHWDSEADMLIVNTIDVAPGTSILSALRNTIGVRALSEYATKVSVHFQARSFYRVPSMMGGENRLTRQLGVNEFAERLFPTLTKYFAGSPDEVPDEVVDRAYVSSNEIGTYESVLETYLKDKTRTIAGNQIRQISTTRNSATGFSEEISKFSQSPTFYSRVQLIVGSVGAGKSTFIKRFYRRILDKDVANRTRWAFLDFNVMPPSGDLKSWIANAFIASFETHNQADIHSLEQMEKIFNVELKQFERGPAKLLKLADEAAYTRQKVELLQRLIEDPVKFAECLARHFGGDKGLGIIVVFDNVDKRSRDQQLTVFEAAQWFKGLTRALVLVNLRDSTFEAHKEEPPLDAFSNAINFYIAPPRFAQVIRKRLELVLEVLPTEVDRKQEYTLAGGITIKYPASRLGEFLLNIYLSLFDQRSTRVASALEALIAKDVRRALGLFGDIIISPHIPTAQITGTLLSQGENRIQEHRIIRALMCGRYKYFTGRSSYIRNIIDVHPEAHRPSNLLYCDILEFLSRSRKTRIDFAQEGYARVGTVVQRMSQLGYDERDADLAINMLVLWGLIEPESLVLDQVKSEDPVRLHASGFIHLRFFLQKVEYLVNATANSSFSSREVAVEIAETWSGQDHLNELTFSARKRILTRLHDNMSFEYSRRCRRHAFYAEAGFGGKSLVNSIQIALESMETRRT